ACRRAPPLLNIRTLSRWPGHQRVHARLRRAMPAIVLCATHILRTPIAAMAATVSPLAPKSVPDMPVIEGVRLSTAAAGIRYRDRTDVLLVQLEPDTTVAGVFTQSKCASAPVDWCRQNLKSRTARALVVNSGNANAFTGKTGREACQFTARLAAKAMGC